MNTEEILLLSSKNKNLAEYLSADVLEEIGIRSVDDYDRDKETQSDWEDRMDKSMKLAMQVVETKTFPHENASNIKFPLLTIGSLQFASRALPQLVRTPEPVNGLVNGQFNQEKALRARRKGQHMSYQLLQQIPAWRDQMDSLLHSVPIIGGEFKKTYHDGKTIRSDWVPAKNIVFDYYAKSLETCRCITEEISVHPQSVVENINLGRWLDVELGTAREPSTDEVADQIQGSSPPDSDRDTPYTFLEQHRYWDLDGDGYEEPYIVTTEHDSKKVVRIDARFDGYEEGPRGIIIEPVHYYTQYKFFPDPSGGIRGIGWGHVLFPINEAINSTVNQLIDAGTDQNTKGGFISKNFASKLNDGKGGDIEVSLNSYMIVDTLGADIADGIWDRPRAEPSAVLYNLLGLMIEYGQRITSVTDTMSGENPPTNQPATTTLALLEQGMKMFSGVHERMFASLESELKKIERLNRLYMDETEYFQVLDVDPLEVPENKEMQHNIAMKMAEAEGIPPQMLEQAMPQLLEMAAQLMMQREIYRTDYEDDGTDVTPSADPKIKTEQQMIMRARMLQEGIQGGLPINPQQAANLYVDAIGFSEIEKKDLVLPPQPPSADPKLELEKVRQEFQEKMEKMRSDTNLKMAQMRDETDRLKLSLQKDTDEKEIELKVEELGLKEDEMRKE